MKPYFAIIASGLLIATLPLRALSQVARLLPFQGRLTDAGGNPIADGARLIQFQIWSDPTGGNLLWAGELHRATINGGLVNVVLGTKNALPENQVDRPAQSFFQQPLYLQITLDANGDNAITAADPLLLPRQGILPVLFANEAANARALNGSDWTAVFGSSDPSKGFMSGERIRSGTVPEDRLPQGALVPKGGMILSASATPPPGFAVTGRLFSSSPVTVVGPASPIARDGPGLAVTETHVYAFGGYAPVESSNFSIPVPFTERYHLAQGAWEQLQDLPVARGRASGVSSGGLIYAVGGLAAGNVISTRVDAFDPSSNKWTLKTQLPDVRLDAGTGVDGDFIYVFGGTTSTFIDFNALLDSAYRYSIRSNQWESLPKMPRARGFPKVAKINGKFYVFGGSLPYDQIYLQYLNGIKIDVYEIATRKWTEIPGPSNLDRLTVSRNDLIYSLDSFGASFVEFNPSNGRMRQLPRPVFPSGSPRAMLALSSGFIVFTDGRAFPARYTPESFDLAPDQNIYVRP